MRDEWEADRHAHLSMGEAETRLPGPELYLRHGIVFTSDEARGIPEVEFTAKIKLEFKRLTIYVFWKIILEEI